MGKGARSHRVGPQARRVFRSISVDIDRVAQRGLGPDPVRTRRAADGRAICGVAGRGQYPWY